MRLCQFAGSVGNAVLERLGGMPPLGLRPLLGRKVATDGCDVDRAPATRVVDPEPVDKEGNCGTGLEVAELELADPAAIAHDARPKLVPYPRHLFRHQEVEYVQTVSVRQPAKANQSEAGGIDV